MLRQAALHLLNVKIETSQLILWPISLDYLDDIFREFTEEITFYMHPRSPKEKKETEEFITSTIEKMKKGEELICAVLD